MEVYLHAFLENKFLGEISLCSQNIISLTFHMRKRFWQELGKQCKIKAETNIPQKTFLVTLVFVHFGYLLPLQFDCLFVCSFQFVLLQLFSRRWCGSLQLVSQRK